MGYQTICRALYDFTPADESNSLELAIQQGDLLYILGHVDDSNWLRARKKASTLDQEEAEGIIPQNYVTRAIPIGQGRALFEYTRQTEEELSFVDGATLDIYDTTDPDWTLVGLYDEFGFVPANYIEFSAQAEPTSPSIDLSTKSHDLSTKRALHERSLDVPSLPPRSISPSARQSTSPPLSPSTQSSPVPSNPEYVTGESAAPQSPKSAHAVDNDDMHLYDINEMVNVLGKKKKMPTILGINMLSQRIRISPKKVQDGPVQEWTADAMTHYSLEGKHVFVELVRPSKSIDFHAGSRDIAEEIVSALRELAGALRAEALKDVVLPPKEAFKRGVALFDFKAEEADEVSVSIGDKLLVVETFDDNQEWWTVRRVRDGAQGVVPRSYVNILNQSIKSTTLPGPNGVPGTRSQSSGSRQQPRTIQDSGLPRMRESKRTASAAAQDQRNARPNRSKVRTWTDRSKSFTVEAEFLGLSDGKINLHKLNGVKIAVPVSKMGIDDLRYVEDMIGKFPKGDHSSMDDSTDGPGPLQVISPRSDAPIRISSTAKKSGKPVHDWVRFFQACDVSAGLCDDYAESFIRESMDESVLPDVDATVLRKLGMREGDIIKVTRALDQRFGRTSGVQNVTSGGLFSGPGGTLRNNTARSREPTAILTALHPTSKADKNAGSASSVGHTRVNDNPSHTSTFDDDAWDIKSSKTPATALLTTARTKTDASPVEARSLAQQPVGSSPSASTHQYSSTPHIIAQNPSGTELPSHSLDKQPTELPSQGLESWTMSASTRDDRGLDMSNITMPINEMATTSLHSGHFPFGGISSAPANSPIYPPYFNTVSNLTPNRPLGGPTAANASLARIPTLVPLRLSTFELGKNMASASNGISQPHNPMFGVDETPMYRLQPHKTGPPPAVKFGVERGDDLSTNGMRRRANIRQATPENPFGF